MKKLRLSTIWLCIVSLICFLGIFTAYGAEEEPKTVKVGYYQAKDFQEGDGVSTLYRGYSYEYMQKVASYTGWQYEYVPGDWASLYEKLAAGQIDMMAGVAYSEDSKEQVLFPQQDMLKETFYIYKDSDDNSMKSANIASYKGKKIGVVEEKKILTALEKWKAENQADIEIVTYKYLADCAAAFNARQIDGFVSADNIVYDYTGITPVEIIGKQPYYLCVSKERPDLLKELDMVLDIINTQDVFYLETLHNKYSADSAVSVFLSLQEQEWMETHTKVKIGYLEHYMPYSDTDEEGKVTGLIADIIPDLFAALPGQAYKPELVYKGFSSHEEMIEALKQGEVDVVFPVGGQIPYAEKMRYQQSSCVVQSGMDLVYAAGDEKDITEKMAVNKDNELQYYYVAANFPDAQILLCNNIEECIKAVRTGEADSTVINVLRSAKLIGMDNDLQIRSLPEPDERCFGVAYGDTALLRLLNHGISILGDGYGLNHAYPYISALMTYTPDDFLKDNLLFIGAIAAGILFIIIMLAAVHIISLRKTAKKEVHQNQVLEDALRQAKEASRVKQVFLNNMSHDMRTPLNAILGILEMNRKCNDPELLEDNRRKAKIAVYQLLNLVDNVMEMNKLESGTEKEEQTETDLSALMTEILDTAILKADEQGIKLVREQKNTAESWPFVIANKEHIREIFRHILENAIKYNKPGGRIYWKDELEFGSGKVIYKCNISDTGIGMKKEFLAHAFEPFAQEKADARTVYQGTGLGLPIARTLIWQMHGTIHIDSNPDEGTSVKFVLPFELAPVKEENAQDPVLKNGENGKEDVENLSGTCILLAEDNELNAEIARFMLEEAGASVVNAKDGKQALKEYLDRPSGSFDAVLMDIMMPVMDGYETAKAIRTCGREDGETIPIIAATACVSEETRQKCAQAGMNEFLEKPLELERTVKTLLYFIK